MIKTLKDLEDIIFPIGFVYDDDETENGSGFICYSYPEDHSGNFIIVRIDSDESYENINKENAMVNEIDAGRLLRYDSNCDTGSVMFSDKKTYVYGTSSYTMQDFVDCIKYFTDITTYTKFLFEHHIANLDYVDKKIKPLLNKYKFKFKSYNLLTLDEKVYPSLSLHYTADRYWHVFIDTDCITGDLIIQDPDDNVFNVTKGEMDMEKFENSLKRIKEKIIK